MCSGTRMGTCFKKCLNFSEKRKCQIPLKTSVSVFGGTDGAGRVRRVSECAQASMLALKNKRLREDGHLSLVTNSSLVDEVQATNDTLHERAVGTAKRGLLQSIPRSATLGKDHLLPHCLASVPLANRRLVGVSLRDAFSGEVFHDLPRWEWSTYFQTVLYLLHCTMDDFSTVRYCTCSCGNKLITSTHSCKI